MSELALRLGFGVERERLLYKLQLLWRCAAMKVLFTYAELLCSLLKDLQINFVKRLAVDERAQHTGRQAEENAVRQQFRE